MAFVPQTLYGRMRTAREWIVAREVEESLTVEHFSEEEEVREFDKQQRLRVHRTIKRQADRSAATRRRRDLAVSLEKKGAAPDLVRSEIRRGFDAELRAAACDASAGALTRYGELVPHDNWPVLFAIGSSAQQVRNELMRDGFPVLPAAGAERLGVVKFSCPPEESILARLADFSTIGALDDPLSNVGRMKPIPHGDGICNHRAMLNLPPTGSGASGVGVTVAVLDTGVDRNHPAFTRLVPDDYRDFTGTGLGDENGHGTHVASIVAGEVSGFDGGWSGIAAGARLVVAKVLPESGLVPLENVLEAMAWALFEKRADIITMSIGDDRTQPNGMSVWTRACEEAVRHGAMVCVAAGNVEIQCPDTVVVPGDARLAVTVGAVGEEGYLAPFSAMGSAEAASSLNGKPSCVAPGVNIVGARSRDAQLPALQGTDGLYTAMSGTSMAAPMIAGCLAVLKSTALSLGWPVGSRELLDLFYGSCRPFTDENAAPYSPGSEIGHGLPDMADAVGAISRKAGTEFVPKRPSHIAVGPATALNPAELAAPCSRCGSAFETRVNVFSSAARCKECGRPICSLCWTLGHRLCEEHETVRLEPRTRPPSTQSEVAAPAGHSNAQRADSPSTPVRKPEGSRIHTADAFLNGFDNKVRQTPSLRRPDATGDLFVNGKGPYEFVRTFGRIRQHECRTKGWFGRTEMLLTAIALTGTPDDDAARPQADLLQQIMGRDGLTIDPKQFHVIGILSLSGWPAAFRSGSLSRGNIRYLFVEPGAGATWNVFPEDQDFGYLFDPEPFDQKVMRASELLGNYEDLVASGGTARLDSICRDTNLSPVLVEHAVAKSGGKFRMLEHHGQKAVIRTSGV